jgi:pentose-5-phosphate-3-epimerase
MDEEQEIKDMIDECFDSMDNHYTPFTTWEMDFLESVRDQFEETKSLSQKQEETLEQIWRKV